MVKGCHKRRVMNWIVKRERYRLRLRGDPPSGRVAVPAWAIYANEHRISVADWHRAGWRPAAYCYALVKP